jgi:ABC-2 type transport system permease protein
MNTPSNAVSESAVQSQAAAPVVMAPGRLFYWCVRRELWEYRSVYLAPLAIAGVILLGDLFVLARLPGTMRHVMTLDPAHQRDALAQHFNIAAALIMGAAFIVSIFYSIDALYGERRDRSILFWKSLPVSDLTTVLAKASIPLVVMPVIAFVITVVTESIMLLLGSMVLLGSGQSVALFWNRLQLYTAMLGLLYHLVTVHMLWYAPLYAWLLLISAWARRSPFLWVVLPPFAIGIFEKIAFHTSYFVAFLLERIGGGISAVNNEEHSGAMPMDPGMHLTPGAFLASLGLWLGLLFAAIFLLAAARVRRYRQPI